jgi:hypothetical protein
VMFLRAEEPLDASALAVMLCMYTPDLPALREHLPANSVRVPPIDHPEFNPSGVIIFDDPDGYRIGISHWGKS